MVVILSRLNVLKIHFRFNGSTRFYYRWIIVWFVKISYLKIMDTFYWHIYVPVSPKKSNHRQRALPMWKDEHDNNRECYRSPGVFQHYIMFIHNGVVLMFAVGPVLIWHQDICNHHVGWSVHNGSISHTPNWVIAIFLIQISNVPTKYILHIDCKIIHFFQGTNSNKETPEYFSFQFQFTSNNGHQSNTWRFSAKIESVVWELWKSLEKDRTMLYHRI